MAAYAPGIILRPWTVGGTTTTEAGEALFTRAKVTASRSLMLWGATGWRYESATRTITSTEGAQVSGDLPVCDQSGWRTEGGAIIDVSVPNSYTHVYTIKVSQFRKDASGREIPVGEERTYANVYIPTGDLSPFDLDLMLPVATVAGGVVLVPDGWSGILAEAQALAAGVSGYDDRINAVEELTVPLSTAVRYADAYTGFFAGQNSAANPSIWTNPSHLNDTGLAQWAAHVVARAGITGTAPKVVWLGDSWVTQNPTILAAAVTNSIAGAVVINAGVSGDTSTAMLARFATAVPADADYVIFNEPGVNDVYQGLTSETVARNLAALVGKIRAIGAIPVFTGMVPLSEHSAPAAARNAEISAQLADPPTYPALPAPAVAIATHPEVGSLGIGGLAKVTTGIDNVAVGPFAGVSLTSGIGNCLVGHEAGTAITAAHNTVAIGHNALRVNVSGSGNTAIGAGALAAHGSTNATGVGVNAGLSSTSTGNTFVGANAGYSPAGVAANATTTGQTQTIIGTESGQSSATQANDVTTLGYRALVGNYNATAVGARASAGAHNSTAIGRGASASGTGSVAIGVDNGATGATATLTNEIALGTPLHRIKILGLPTTNPAIAGYLWNDGGTVKVSAG